MKKIVKLLFGIFLILLGFDIIGNIEYVGLLMGSLIIGLGIWTIKSNF